MKSEDIYQLHDTYQAIINRRRSFVVQLIAGRIYARDYCAEKEEIRTCFS
jgi:hypothetical protein